MKPVSAFYTKLFSAILTALVTLSLQLNVFAQRDPEPQTAVPAEASGFEFAFPAMGTLVSFKAYHANEAVVEQAFEAARTEVLRLSAVLTDYDKSSETSKLSEAACVSPVPVSDELWAVLKSSDYWFKTTEGHFDSSLGSLTKLWRKYRRARKVPTNTQVSSALDSVGWQHVELLEAEQSVQFGKSGIRLDFGALGKGFIVDRAFQTLKNKGLECCLIDISGNMRCGEPPPGRDGWRIAVSALERGGAPLRIIELRDVAIATSGDLWQFSLVEGKRRSHILDPQTGYGVLGPVSATVVAKNATDADAFATASCVASDERAFELAETLELELLKARLTDDGIEERTTKGFPAAVEQAEE